MQAERRYNDVSVYVRADPGKVSLALEHYDTVEVILTESQAIDLGNLLLQAQHSAALQQMRLEEEDGTD